MYIDFRNLLDYRSAAEMLGYSETSLRRLVSEHRIGCLHIGRKVRFSKENLESYVRTQEAK